MLARGELHTIGATTIDEYRKHIEKDAGPRASFPAGDGWRADRRGHDLDSARTARALRIHHGVKFKDAALVAAAVLSHRYIADRFLPDKAIDLIDEAA